MLYTYRFSPNLILISGKSDNDNSSGTSKRMADQVEYNKPIKVSKSYDS